MSKSLSAEQPTAPRRKLSLLLLLGMILSAGGCRTTSDNQIDLLERELRVQEDYIYELEDYVVEYSEKLRDCRGCAPPQTAVYSAEVYEPELELAPKRSKKSKRRRMEKEESLLEPVEEPAVEPIEETEDDDLPSPLEPETTPETSPEDLEVPDSIDFDLDEPVSDLGEARPLQQVSASALEYQPSDEGLLIIPDPVGFASDSEVTVESDEQFVEELFADDHLEEESLALADRVAERLEVTQLFRGEGDDLSPRNRSPQNLLAVVEALDVNDEPVDLDGEVSLMVMTNQEDTPKRLKRWNFTAEETIAAWQSSDLGDGLHLELPLENLELPDTPLELWVRLVTTDGRKLLTQLPFDASQLKDIAAAGPQPLPARLTRADGESEGSGAPVNSTPIETQRIPPTSSQLKLAKNQEPANQPRWRASMQRTDRTAKGFATSSSKSTGWTTQPPGRQPPSRQPNVPARVASRPSPVPPKAPTWTSERRVLPTGTR